MGKPYCVECKWLEMRLSLDEGSNFVCLKGRPVADEGLIWRRSCEEFEPLEG